MLELSESERYRTMTNAELLSVVLCSDNKSMEKCAQALFEDDRVYNTAVELSRKAEVGREDAEKMLAVPFFYQNIKLKIIFLLLHHRIKFPATDMKTFNTAGTCRPNEHYMVDITERLEIIKKMVIKGDYFCINRGRQYGKTTTLEAGSSVEMFLMKIDQYVKQPVINNPQLLRKSGWK